jgi:ubiquinone/menaquinone biosynthesis C-methylase UbiE
MTEWARKLFVERADLSIKIMNLRWPYTEKIVDGMINVLKEKGISSGRLLDLCCGNGRISTHFAKRGFEAIGIDYSNYYLVDAKKRAEMHEVSDHVIFVEGDVRNLKAVLKDYEERFDVVVNAWTSIGYSTIEDDLSIFEQARQLSKDSAILFIVDTMHAGRASMRPNQTSFLEIDDTVLLEKSTYDQSSSEKRTTWTFYRKIGNDLHYLDELEYVINVYSLSELSALLKKAGWQIEAYYGNISTQQPMSPLTGMNIIAKAA